MKEILFYRKESKIDYRLPDDGVVTAETLQVGALLRIADSMEIVAQDYRRLIAENESLRNRIKGIVADLKTERRRVAAYRGRLHRMQK